MTSEARHFSTLTRFVVWLVGLTVALPLAAKEAMLSDADIDNLVRRSYQYVAMYNVNNKGVLKFGGWNICAPDTELKDHTFKIIARPNNDTLYILKMLTTNSLERAHASNSG